MKKGLVLLLALNYILLTSGIVVNIHYCMGRVAGVTYGHEAELQCDKCGMEKKDGCCETEHKLVKGDSDHLLAKTVSTPFLITTAVPPVYPDFIAQVPSQKELYNSRYHSPPDFRGNHLSVHNSVFRI